MAKDTFYFSHDYNARTDDKIKRLIRVHGMTGYGIFWSIVEDLYNNANALRLDCDGIAYDLHVQCDMVKSIISDFDLFITEENTFGSISIERRLIDRDNKSEKARESAFKRWGRIDGSTDEMPTHSDSNAIKERIEKERKEKEIKKSEAMASAKLRKTEFKNSLIHFSDQYSKEMINAFFIFWTEMNKSGTKMKWELQQTWETNLRLATWSRKENKKPDIPVLSKDEKEKLKTDVWDKSVNDNEWIKITANLFKLSEVAMKHEVTTFIQSLYAKEDFYKPILEIKSHFVNYKNKQKI